MDACIAGYLQGGMFCYQAAAYRREEGIESVVAFGSPVDTHAGMPFGLPERLAGSAAGLLGGHAAVPPVGPDDERGAGRSRAARGWRWPDALSRPRSGRRCAATA